MAKITSIVDDGMPSIQGEQQSTTDAHLYATDDQVDEYIRRMSDGVINCRERGRHSFAPVRVTGMHFVGVTPLGLLVRRVLCDSCLMVERVEEWDVRHKRGKVTRAELVSARLDYLDPTYRADRGHGRMRPRQIRNAVASLALEGSSFRETLKSAHEALKFRNSHE